MGLAERSPDRGEHLIFVHVPKTAGTTIRAALATVYAPAERAFVYHPSVPDSVTTEGLAAWSHERRAGLRLVMGHIAFGIHAELPGPSRYVTMLREPMDRLISLFDYFRSGTFPEGTGAARQHDRLVAEDIDIDVYAFDTKHPRWDNQMVRLLSGRNDAPFGRCDETMLRQALDNVDERFHGILLQEHMAPSMNALAAITGRPLPSLAERQRRDGRGWRVLQRIRREVVWHNATRGRRPLDEVDPAALERMRDLNQLDLELYRVAAERFDSTVRDVTAEPTPH